MFKKLFKKKQSAIAPDQADCIVPNHLAAQSVPDSAQESRTWFQRLKASLGRTRTALVHGLESIMFRQKVIDDAMIESFEQVLLSADFGLDTTQDILRGLLYEVKKQGIRDAHDVIKCLRTQLQMGLEPFCTAWSIQHKPSILLIIGCNGSGKTTTIGKLAYYFLNHNLKVMLAAGDTFRAAAIEQLKIWGERANIPVIAQSRGADSASVVYDAMISAQTKQYDVLLADTAGRLHTNSHLMQELLKVKRVLHKHNAQAPHEIFLVLDASLGQNMLSQATLFHEALGVTGLILTKLDGTAKGGAIFSVINRLRLPIRFIGIGEQINDLRPFCATEFVQALFESETSMKS